MLKEISVMAIALTVMGASSLQAEEANNINDNQQLMAINYEGQVSKSDARKIMKKYLKSKESYKKIRIGKIQKVNNKWKVILTSLTRIPVSKAYVNDKTGEITFKR